MSSHIWCHGPSCHTYVTTDRVRGSKGSKVLRTRKIKQNQWNSRSIWGFFCSMGCYNDFAKEYMADIVRIAPRNEPLETRIEDPTKDKCTTSWGHTYYNHTIKKIDTSNDVG